MNQDSYKQAAAHAALDYIRPKLHRDSIIGVGTGSTTNYFIDRLSELRDEFAGTVASSAASEQRLKAYDIPVHELNNVSEVTVYVDGADEINPRLELIKGGGAALTREKIVAAAAKEFVCIADSSKWVEQLGAFPLPVEVIPIARSYVARQLVTLGADPVYRQGVVTDNGNVILDLFHFSIPTPRLIEERINHIAGVVSNGIFALRPADIVLLAGADGVEQRVVQV